MTLDLTGKKVVVTGGKHSVGRAIAEAVAREGADVVIWLRKCNDEVNGGKVLPITLLEIPSQLPNGGAPTSLWGQTVFTLKDFWKIFGIKMHGIGKDTCEAICQAPK